MHVHTCTCTIHAYVQCMYVYVYNTCTYMCTFMHRATKHLHTAFYRLIAMAQIVAT